jgi:hypothetical protein
MWVKILKGFFWTQILKGLKKGTKRGPNELIIDSMKALSMLKETCLKVFQKVMP